MKALRSTWLTIAFGVGLVMIFLGERLLSTGEGRKLATGLGALLVLGAFVFRIVRSIEADAERRSSERLLAGLAGLGVVGLYVYFAQSDVWAKVAGERLLDASPRVALVLSALYSILLASALLPMVLGEAAYAAVIYAPRIEARRIRDAVGSGLGLVAVLVFAFAAEYVLDVRDHTWDFSYFRTSRAGDATHKLVRNLDTPLEVAMFFPPANEVSQEVVDYFRPLASESTRLKLESYDAALDLARARELNVVSNGAVVLKSGQRKETITLPLELDHARGDLRKFDQSVQDKMFALTRSRKTLYLTSGHGERSTGPAGGADGRARITQLKTRLEALNQDVKTLSAADGLASEIPADASVVVIAGPTAPFLAEELAALNRYFARGGRILVALDPETAPDLSALLTPLGVTMEKPTLVNDRFFVPRTHTPSDRANIATATFSSHPVVTSLSQSQGRIPMVFVGAGYLEEAKSKPVQISVDFAVRSHPSTFADLNGNFAFDPPAEARKTWPIVAAAARHTFGKPGDKPLDSRALITADSDWMSDLALDTAGNPLFVRDAFIWLIGEEAVAGPVNKETDVRIEHTRGQDTAYFFLTIFGFPALVLGAGAFGTRRRRRSPGASPEVKS